MAGLAAARKKGRVGGQPRRLTADKAAAGRKLLEGGTSAREVADVLGVSVATLYRWKATYGGLRPSEAHRLRALEDENQRLKKLPAKAV